MGAETRHTSGRGPMGVHWRQQEGNLIRTLRHAAGLTQEQLATRIGLAHKQTISGIEMGRQHVPPERCEDFALALGERARTFSAFLLRWQSPWLFAGIFGRDAMLTRELQAAGERDGRGWAPKAVDKH